MAKKKEPTKEPTKDQEAVKELCPVCGRLELDHGVCPECG